MDPAHVDQVLESLKTATSLIFVGAFNSLKEAGMSESRSMELAAEQIELMTVAIREEIADLHEGQG